MNRRENRCYYSDCQKLFQNKVYLVTHVNNQHLQVPTYICASCEMIFTSNSEYSIHYKSHKSTTKRANLPLNLLDNYSLNENTEYLPPSFTALPVLPGIEIERTRLAHKYKLPISVKLYDMLCSRAHLDSNT